jgi:hypothetical protein
MACTSWSRVGVVALLASMATLVASAQADGKKEPVISVCEILSDPLRFDGKVVQIRARMTGTDEGSWFIDENCDGVLETDGHVWPSEIAMAPAPSLIAPRPLTYLHRVDFNFDFGSSQRLTQKAQMLLRTVPVECLMWTYTGMFETRSDWSKVKKVYPNGTWIFLGFGHLGEAPGQLIPKSADNVEAIPNCKANPK